MAITTPGRLLVDAALPEGYRGSDDVLDGKTLGRLMTRLAKERPDDYVNTLQNLNDVGRRVATEYGGPASLSLDDLIPPPGVAARKEAMRREVHTIMQSDKLSSDDKRLAMAAALDRGHAGLDEAMASELATTDRAFGHQLLAGARGKPSQARQILVGNIINNDADGNILAYPGLEGFGEGMTPTGYWATTHAGRKGYVDIQLATADAGYFGKLITNVAHRAVVSEPDCGAADVGIDVAGDDKDNVGSVLAHDTPFLKRGTFITDEHLPLLEGSRIMVRSPITCRTADGVCAMCSGKREHGELPDIGDTLGINAVRSFVEPLTQGAISSKHTGADLSRLKGKSAFQRVAQFMQVPEEFAGGAVLAEDDGLVAAVSKAPQGGSTITVGGRAYHVPEGTAVTAKPGDRVEAGDVLSEGLPNPRDVIRHKGVGAGRLYFMEKMGELLRTGNASTSRRNLELLARSFVGKVEITDPDGYNGYLPGDVASFDAVQAGWEPRKDSELKSAGAAANLFLERPYLHYSVGTRVTPSVIKRMKEAKLGQVMVNRAPPPFAPKVVRTSAYLGADTDWSVRLAGEDLVRGMQATAARGGKAQKHGTSFYPELAFMGFEHGEQLDR